MNSEQLLRRIRQNVFSYPQSKDNQLTVVIEYLKLRVARNKPSPTTGKYSGLTARELSLTGTCETDWY